MYVSSRVNSKEGTLLFNILGSFAQFERDLIVERTTEDRESKRTGKAHGEKST